MPNLGNNRLRNQVPSRHVVLRPNLHLSLLQNPVVDRLFIHQDNLLVSHRESLLQNPVVGRPVVLLDSQLDSLLHNPLPYPQGNHSQDQVVDRQLIRRLNLLPIQLLNHEETQLLSRQDNLLHSLLHSPLAFHTQLLDQVVSRQVFLR